MGFALILLGCYLATRPSRHLAPRPVVAAARAGVPIATAVAEDAEHPVGRPEDHGHVRSCIWRRVSAVRRGPLRPSAVLGSFTFAARATRFGEAALIGRGMATEGVPSIAAVLVAAVLAVGLVVVGVLTMGRRGHGTPRRPDSGR